MTKNAFESRKITKCLFMNLSVKNASTSRRSLFEATSSHSAKPAAGKNSRGCWVCPRLTRLLGQALYRLPRGPAARIVAVSLARYQRQAAEWLKPAPNRLARPFCPTESLTPFSPLDYTAIVGIISCTVSELRNFCASGQSLVRKTGV